MGTLAKIHKTGDEGKHTNYRGIVVSSSVGKLFGTLFQKQFTRYFCINNLRNISQCGFTSCGCCPHLIKAAIEVCRLIRDGVHTEPKCPSPDFKQRFVTCPLVENKKAAAEQQPLHLSYNLVSQDTVWIRTPQRTGVIVLAQKLPMSGQPEDR